MRQLEQYLRPHVVQSHHRNCRQHRKQQRRCQNNGEIEFMPIFRLHKIL